ncbi:MAG: thioredoxin domain-containing protein [Candidatus Acidiferrales bacterium]
MNLPIHPARRIPSHALTLFALALILVPASHAQTKSVSTKTHAKPAAPESLPAPMKTIGTKSAPITMEVFSDYQCPACRAFFENTLRFMINDYVASGKVYLVHRDFPLPMHPYSMDAARWANAAARIGRFETVDAALFDNQDKWTKDGSMEQYISTALGPTDFKRVQKLVAGCLTQTPGNTGGAASGHSCELDTFIQQDQALGKQVPVNSTPTIVITYKGQRYPPMAGMFTWPIMKQYLDSLMSQ